MQGISGPKFNSPCTLFYRIHLKVHRGKVWHTLLCVIKPTNIGLRNPAVLLAALTIPMTTEAFRGATSKMLTWKPAYTIPAAAPATHIHPMTASAFLKYPAIRMNRPAVSAPIRENQNKGAMLLEEKGASGTFPLFKGFQYHNFFF